MMSERAFGLGNRRESRKRDVRVQSTPTRVLVRPLPQSGPERGNQEAPREVEMSATASGPPRLMGRAAELEILSGLLDRVSERDGALVVRGEPGIGKPALLGYLADGASSGCDRSRWEG
jgi:hypothetical protein